MQDLVALLDRYYITVTKQPNDKSFFIALADYLVFIETTPDIEKVANRYNTKQKEDHADLIAIEKDIIQETISASKKLDSILKKNKVSYPELIDLQKTFQNWLNQENASTNPHALSVFGSFKAILNNLYEHEHRALIADFIISSDHNGQWLIDKFIFAPSLDKREGVLIALKECGVAHYWEDWGKLALVYQAIIQGSKIWTSIITRRKEKTPDGNQAHLDALGWATVKGEMDKIIEGSNSKAYLFIREEYEHALSRIHLNLITQLQQPHMTSQQAIIFSPERGILTIKDQEIKTRKFNDQYHALNIILAKQKDLSREWFFSEISEEYDLMGRFTDKKFYNAIYQINQKLKGVGIPDFFITTRQSAKINPKYLS